MANHAPSGLDSIRTSNEDDVVRFLVTDFGFSDTDGNSFIGIIVTTVPTGGRLLIGSGNQVVAGQFISLAELSPQFSGLRFIPDLNQNGAPYASFTFQVRDNGGTADGGVDTDQTPNTMLINVIAQPDAPRIFNLGATVSQFVPRFVEHGPPVFIDLARDVTVTDVDSANFDGGVLFIGYPSNSPDFAPYENFNIAEGNGITVASQGVGGLVKFNGTTFGTITIDHDGLLQVDFNAEATPVVVQTLINQLTYEVTNFGSTPSLRRNPVLGIKDGTGGEVLNTSINIDLVAINDPGQLRNLDPTVAFDRATVTASAQLLDPQVTYSDPENNFGSGALQVSGLLPEDVLSIRNQGADAGQIGTSGTAVTYGGVTIGTFSGGSSGTGPLTVTFNNNATAAAVDALLDNLTYFNTGATPTSSHNLTLFLLNQVGQQITRSIEIRIGDTVTGTPASESLNGTAAPEIFRGNGGDDAMAGGGGDDTYHVDSAGDTVTEAIGQGRDAIYASVNFAIGAASEIEILQGVGAAALTLTGNGIGNVIFGTDAGDTLNGGGGSDTIRGFGGNDTINGGEGDDNIDGGYEADAMAGGAGSDLYFVDNTGDVVTEAAGEGSDRIVATLTYSLAADSEVEVLEASGDAGAINLFGNGISNLIRGNGSDNALEGGAGSDLLQGFGGNDNLTGGADNDIMQGGLGNDSYSVDSSGDVVTENAGEGIDRIVALVSYVLAAGTEVETLDALSGTGAINLTGNEHSHLIQGNNGVNILLGGSGVDTLRGFGGNDFIAGGAGIDRMEGGAGDDTYYVDNAEDRVVELTGEGTADRVATSVSYTLPTPFIEILEAVDLSSTEAMDLFGNNIDNTIIGNNGANRLEGRDANDILIGAGGNDLLIGGTGIDRMEGGTGDDTYYVDNAEDRVVELTGGGTADRVATSVSYTLPTPFIEILEALNLSSTNAMDLFGNGIDNTIIGNNGANRLEGRDGNDILIGAGGDDLLIGGTGIDRMEGGTGNDTYLVDNSADLVIEAAGSGSDRIATSASYVILDAAEVELMDALNLSATDAFDLTGNQFGQTIIGNNGVNVIDGKGGADTLVGAGGADIFTFTTALGRGNIDAILDFVHAGDMIAMDDAVFAGIGPLGALSASAFATGFAAGDADDRIIYNSATGALFFDADGNGAGVAVQYATLSTGLTLSASDFMVI